MGSVSTQLALTQFRAPGGLTVPASWSYVGSVGRALGLHACSALTVGLWQVWVREGWVKGEQQGSRLGKGVQPQGQEGSQQ